MKFKVLLQVQTHGIEHNIYFTSREEAQEVYKKYLSIIEDINKIYPASSFFSPSNTMKKIQFNFTSYEGEHSFNVSSIVSISVIDLEKWVEIKREVNGINLTEQYILEQKANMINY
jgi:hypothetical protein